MTEPTVFDYWLSQNAVNYKWQLNYLRAEGVNGTTDGDVVTFQSEADSELGKFLDGKSFNVLTWAEVSATIVPPLVTPAESVIAKPQVEVTPEPVVEETKVVEPEPVVIPEPTPEPTSTPAPRRTRKPVPHVEPVVEPTVEEKTDVASPTVPTESEPPTDGSSTPAA